MEHLRHEENLDIDRRSVCCTIIAAMKRIATTVDVGLETDKNSCIIDFLGAEDLEFETLMDVEDINLSYELLFRFVMEMGIKHLHLSFVGPNLLGRNPPLNRIDTSYFELTVSIECHSCLYHDYHNARKMEGVTTFPNLVLMLNAGIWGYTSWLPTLDVFSMLSDNCISPDTVGVDDRACALSQNCFCTSSSSNSSSSSSKIFMRNGPHFVVTSYTLEEAEDDEDTIREHFRASEKGVSTQTALIIDQRDPGETDSAGSDKIAKLHWLWEAEVNPHRSSLQIDRRTKVNGREYFSNHAWQCFEFIVK